MPGVAGNIISNLVNRTKGLDEIHDDVATLDGIVDVPAKDSTDDVQMSDVVGKKDDTAVGAVGTTKSLVAYLKGILTDTIAIQTLHNVPTKDAATDAQMRDVVGKKDDTAVTTVGTTKTLMAYIKGALNGIASLPTTSYFAQTVAIKMNSLQTINNTQATKVFVNAVVPAGLISTTNAEAKKVMLLITGTYVNTYAGTNALDSTTAAHNQWQYKAGGAGAYADLTNADADGQMLDNDWRTPKEGGAGSFSMMFDISTVADDDIDAAVSVQLLNGRSEQASMEIVVNAFLIVLWQK